jgi:excisionase family DNA binding protein
LTAQDWSSRRRTRTSTADTRLYRPAEVAEILGCSEWWVKEQARKRRIPFAWIGGSYRFTAEHIAEIVRASEVRPTGRASGAPDIAASREQHPQQQAQTVARLTARNPRRARQANQQPPTAA